MIPAQFAYAAALLNLIGCGSYAFDTLRSRTQPNRVTWVLWTVSSGIIFFGQIGEGVGASAALSFAGSFGPLLVVIASFLNKDAYWEIKRLDFVCGGIAIVALILWGVTKSGLIAIYFSLLADITATLPTVIKSYLYPKTEAPLTYGIAVLAGAITLLTVKQWEAATYLFPAYVIVSCGLIFILIKFPKLRLTRLHSQS